MGGAALIIRKMTASFGVLQNRTLELQPGLNIIEAPNEYGKSTWCAFLRAMLYGVDTAQRAHAGVKPDKVLYAPWSGAPMEGTMELTHEGKDITLTRTTRTPNAPMREFSAVYTGTSQPVSGITAENVGETLTGATLPVFERTAFIGAGSLGVRHTAELEKKIASLVTSGEESSSFTEASERLRALQRKCRYHGAGRLPELEAQISDTRARLDAMDSVAQKLAETEERVQSLQAERTVVPETPSEEDTAERERIEEELAQCTAEADAERLYAARCGKNAASIREELRQSTFHGADPDSVAERVRSDTERCERAGKTAKAAVPGTWLWILFLVLAAGLAYAGMRFQKLCWAGAVACLLTAIAFAVARCFIKRDRKMAAKLSEKILHRYGAASAADIPTLFENYRKRWNEAAELDASCERSREALRTLSEKELALRGTPTDTGTAAGAGESAEERQLREEAARLRGRLEALGDPMAEESRLRELEAEHTRLEAELESLNTALEEMKIADEEMQAETSPALARAAAEILSQLTHGAYTELTLDRMLNVNVRAEGDTVAHESAYLSRGTVDQIYLALRLALCEKLLTGADPCPIVLDDALINFDDERMAAAVDTLEALSQHRQILLFTCHRREKEYIERKEPEESEPPEEPEPTQWNDPEPYETPNDPAPWDDPQEPDE
jgi:hypothetical protein